MLTTIVLACALIGYSRNLNRLINGGRCVIKLTVRLSVCRWRRAVLCAFWCRVLPHHSVRVYNVGILIARS